MLSAALAAATHAGAAQSGTFDEVVKALYRPWQAEQVALSPDGAHVAYTQHEKGELSIYIMAVNRTEKKFKMVVEGDRPMPRSRVKVPARLRFMEWSSPTRLIFAPTPSFTQISQEAPMATAPIFAVNLDGSDLKVLAKSGDFSVGRPNFGTEVTAEQSIGRLKGATIGRMNTIRGLKVGRSALLVEAMGMNEVPTELFAIDVMTGAKKSVNEDYETGRHFYDPLGNLRMLYPHPMYDPKRTFRYKIGGALDRWTDMNAAWVGATMRPFTVTVDNYFGERAWPIGVDANPDVIYYASNIGRDTLGIYAFDAKTKRRTALALEDPHVDLAALNPDTADAALVLDPVSGKLAGVRVVGTVPLTRWVEAELVAIQREVDEQFPRRTVEVLQWDDARRRFLLRVTGGIEAGRYYVFQRTENVMVEVLRAAPWLRNADLNPGTAFEFDTAGGLHLSGQLIFPRKPRLNPPPLLIDFSDGLMGSAQPGFDREAQVLAEMGFVVARINCRGMSGFGLAHRAAVRTGGDHVPVEDALAAIESIAARHVIDRKRIATIGHGLGGYLALRALQREPGVFRCGIAIDAPLAPANWLRPEASTIMSGLDRSANEGSTMSARPSTPARSTAAPIDFVQEAQRKFFFGDAPHLTSVLDEVERLTKPAMLIVNSSPRSEIAVQNEVLRSRLARSGRSPIWVQADGTEDADSIEERVKMYRRIEEFFNLSLYDFGVKVGPTEVVK